MPLMGFIDSALIVNILQDVGYKLAEARSLFGLVDRHGKYACFDAVSVNHCFANGASSGYFAC